MSNKLRMNANTRESKNRKLLPIGVHSRPLAVKESLFDRVAAILEQARGNVVRAVNTNMVLAYWLIGREIVEEVQRGKGRAEYGKQVFENLSVKLTAKYGKGFSVTNLQYFRQFYQQFNNRTAIHHPAGGEFEVEAIPSPTGREMTHSKKSYPTGTELLRGFSPQLSWSHYRALMRVENRSLDLKMRAS